MQKKHNKRKDISLYNGDTLLSKDNMTRQALFILGFVSSP